MKKCDRSSGKNQREYHIIVPLKKLRNQFNQSMKSRLKHYRKQGLLNIRKDLNDLRDQIILKCRKKVKVNHKIEPRNLLDLMTNNLKIAVNRSSKCVNSLNKMSSISPMLKNSVE